VVLELATSLTYDTTYVQIYHWYIFVRACYTDSRGTRIFPSSCHTSTTEDQQFGAKGRLVVIHITALCKGISRSNMYKGLGLSDSHRREVARQGASRTQERHITFFFIRV
jgi:hypothetical protein